MYNVIAAMKRKPTTSADAVIDSENLCLKYVSNIQCTYFYLHFGLIVIYQNCHQDISLV